MADAPEIPEAKDPFEKMVAISIAVIAVLLSYVSMKGDNGKTDAIINTNEAANKWAQYQSNSLKLHMTEMETDLLSILPGAGETTKKREDLESKAEKYKSEKAKAQEQAEEFKKEAKKGSDMNDRCDFAGLFLQISIVIASVAILSSQRLLWFVSLGLAIFGAVKFFF
ncbi:MAG: DUF4337 domain-containing protein [Verrucomicrobiaceae bacterium]